MRLTLHVEGIPNALQFSFAWTTVAKDIFIQQPLDAPVVLHPWDLVHGLKASHIN